MSQIRLLPQSDVLARLDELNDILIDCVAGNASVGFMSPFNPEQGAAYWRSVALAVGRGEVLIWGALVEGRLMGTVQVGFALKPNQPHRADLMKLLVHRAARGRGLSSALMAAAEAGAAQANRTLLVLDTAKGDLAESIYEKLGWQRSGEIPDYALYPDGRFCDTVIFYKRLA